MEAGDLCVLGVAFFAIATVYSSVGFGGGSSYLALLALFLPDFLAIRSIALICNASVVLGSTYLYFQQGHARWGELIPFVSASIPLAFIGATFRLEEEVFFLLLGISLVLASLIMVWQVLRIHGRYEKVGTYPVAIRYVLGGLVGLLSGLVGIGGGIFLSPLLNNIRFDKSVKIAALASFFILVNSMSGLMGLIYRGSLQLPIAETAVLVLAVIAGGQLGIRLSLRRFSPRHLKLITAVLVMAVGLRILLVK